MNEEFPKSYDPKAVEEKWYAFWEQHQFFKAHTTSKKKPYCISIPPPNVTGVLHMGHALVDTLQDVLIRWKRMCGYEALWVPGTDHAGIATQTVVERHLLAKMGKRRTDFSREEFLAHVLAWKEQSQERIVDQIKRLGCSCDWSRLAFTMDEPRNKAVRTMFKKMFDNGLIYRGDYLVNWDPVTQTALADDEVEYEDRDSYLWYFKYPIEKSSAFITVATTRPETMLGDTAIAVSPTDVRYQDLIGKRVILPLMDRAIPVCADHHVDPSFGTGAVKVTPAHDPNDYEMALRQQLPMINIMTADGRINEQGGTFRGLSMQEARKAVVDAMQSLGLVVKIDPHRLRVGTSYRSKAVIEPYLSKQWFVRMSGFKDILRALVEDKRVKLIPENWETTYFHWIDNLRDWCISRQLWWGHRIPIWYRKDDPATMLCHDGAETPDEVKKEPDAWRQDEDVLDTWFSSALWPFSVLGWPDATEDLKTFYPNSTLITGHDILFFWVARMLLMGEYALGQPPFPETFLHGLIYGKSYWRYAKEGSISYLSSKEALPYDLGQPVPPDIHSKWEKMSKSKGNIIDPIEIIDTYGTDAMRMGLCASATHARQIDLDRRRFEEFKNFANKIWNGARFVFQNIEDLSLGAFATGIDLASLALEDRWILSLLNRIVRDVNQELGQYAFDKAALLSYDFFWKEFCAYYVELVKPVLFGKTGSSAARETKQKILTIVLCTVIRLLHPMAPFITEELFQKLKSKFSIEAVAKLLCPEKSMILRPFESGGQAATAHPTISTPSGSIEEEGLEEPQKGPQKGDFNGQMSFATASINQLSSHTDPYTQATLEALSCPACIVAPYPELIRAEDIDPDIEATFSYLDQVLHAVRTIRAEMQLPPGTPTDLIIQASAEEPQRILVERNQAILLALVRITSLQFTETEQELPFSASTLIGPLKLIIPLPQAFKEKEQMRLVKEKEKLIEQQNQLRVQLSNPAFLEKAPKPLIEKLQGSLTQAEMALAEVMKKLSMLEL